jgi:hypothetical protein
VPPSTTDPAAQALAIFDNALRQCGGTTFLVSQQETREGDDPSQPDETASERVAATGLGDTYEVDVDLIDPGGSVGDTVSWVIGLPDGSLTPQQSDAQQAADACSALQ